MITQAKIAPPKAHGHRRHWTASIVGLLIALVFVVGALLRPIRVSGRAGGLSEDPLMWKRPFSWDNTKPSLVLTWHVCSERPHRECARLILPRDYSDPLGATVVIALVRVVSCFPADSPEYRGPVLINPGGPGLSGVDYVMKAGDHFRTVLGCHFDVVGFDPRGVGHSTPGVSFFKTPADRALWGEIMSIVGRGVDGLAKVWARAQILGRLASESDSNVLAYINTENTARDMLRIVQAHQREKLQYWGFSYGSVLGATFAALFPDKIERLVIDGVADAENYYSTLWDNNLLDTDKTLQAFFDHCSLAGPNLCPFYAPTPEQISENLNALYAAVSARPVPVFTRTGYALVDYAYLRLAVFTALRTPYQAFHTLARGLAGLASGDGTVLYQMLAVRRFACSCGEPEPFVGASGEAQVAIMCGDGQVVPRDFESTETFYKKLSDASPWADAWAKMHISCSKWLARIPKDPFPRAFCGQDKFPPPFTWKHRRAKKMSEGFSGSVVLTQDSPGHLSISARSLCTQKYVRAYFVDGKLPPVGEICPVIGTPFKKQIQDGLEGQISFNFEAISHEDRELLDAIEQIHSSLPSALF